MAKRVVFFTGAGMSAESGIKTFRDHDGLWEGYDLMEVAHIDAWNSKSNQNEARQLMLNFYNQRRRQLFEVNPNDGHLAIAAFEKKFPDTWVITQNVDDLHERAASKNVLHLHGELRKVRSELDSAYILDWNEDVHLGDVCPKGGQLRPHIVWFGEEVPAMQEAFCIAKEADLFLVIGTSLQVYPAAQLVHEIDFDVPLYVVDPQAKSISLPNRKAFLFAEKAGEKVPFLVQKWLKEAF